MDGSLQLKNQLYRYLVYYYKLDIKIVASVEGGVKM